MPGIPIHVHNDESAEVIPLIAPIKKLIRPSNAPMIELIIAIGILPSAFHAVSQSPVNTAEINFMI